MANLIPVDHDPFDLAGMLAAAGPSDWQRGVETAQGFDRPTNAPQSERDYARELMMGMGWAGGDLQKNAPLLWETAPGRMAQGLGRFARGETPYAGPGLRRGDYTDDPTAHHPVEPMINDAMNVADVMSLGGFPMATRGALGAMGGKLIQPEGIRAYHGSPHDFDRFDISKIGTGEGAQSYGHGLYFAENPATAKSYRDSLSNPGDRLRVTSKFQDAIIPLDNASNTPHSQWLAARTLAEAGGDIETAISRARHLARNGIGASPESLAQLEKWREHDAKFTIEGANPGKMYEVNINAKPEQFLDWDKPLSSHSPDIQEALFKAGGTNPKSLAYGELKSRYLSPLSDAMRGTEFSRFVTPENILNGNVNMSAVAKSLEGDPARLAKIESIIDAHKNDPTIFANQDLSVPGRNAYMKMTDSGPSGSTAYGIMDSRREPQASAALLEHGIPGIKYLDQGSRGAENWIARHPQGGTWEHPNEQLARAFIAKNPEYSLEVPKRTSNYVLFDDKLVDILRKYGIAGLAALPPAVAAHVQSRLVPVDHDPFAQGPRFVPVDHDPFATQ